jgi:hypothetical protein
VEYLLLRIKTSFGRLVGLRHSLPLSKTINMKSSTYLNGVLTVIAVCLVLLTLAATGLLPAAYANDGNKKMVQVPVNSDGSINVKFVKGETMDVNIESCGTSAFYHAEPIEVEIKK